MQMHSRLACWPLAVACFAAHAAAPPRAAQPIVACLIKAAAALEFNGDMYLGLGKGSVEKSFGIADPVGKIPITRQTRFNIASAGKMFTAVGVGRLVDRGLIDFNAPISRYLSNLDPVIGAIKVSQLLNHTSGLGNYFDPSHSAAIQSARTATDLLPLALSEPPAFPPGSKREYSNSGFAVLGAIIERLSGLSYTEFIEQEILRPLNMRRTAFDVKDGAVPISRKLSDDKQVAPFAPLLLKSSPSGGIYSTAQDLAIFMTALDRGRLVTSATLSQLWTPRPIPGGEQFYGYGFYVRSESPRRVGHGGGAPGINAEVALYPESHRQIISLSNYDPPAATRMVTVLEKALFAADPTSACEAALSAVRRSQRVAAKGTPALAVAPTSNPPRGS